jgi:acyl-CoA thioester hydrolase
MPGAAILSKALSSEAPHGDAAGAGPDRAGRETPGDVRFSWSTPVFFDDLDAMGMLHNAHYLRLIERATSAFFEANGWRWRRGAALNPDQHYVVAEQSLRYLEPVRDPGELVIELWVSELGQSSATFAFAVSSADGTHLHARARRVHVKLDPVSLRPAPWTSELRDQLATLVRRPA